MSTIVLDETSPAIQHLCKRDKRLAKVIKMVGPITYEVESKDPYAFLIHEIIEQMLSIQSGRKIYANLEALCKGKITPEIISTLTDNEIKNIGTSNAKVSYIRSITDAVIAGNLVFEELLVLSDDEVNKKLMSIRGIGKWTAKMYLIFVLDRPDILPYEDAAFLQAYKWLYNTNDVNKKAIESKCRKWKPYSSIASRYLYRALDSGLTKEVFHLYKE